MGGNCLACIYSLPTAWQEDDLSGWLRKRDGMFWLSFFWASVPFGLSPSVGHIYFLSVHGGRPEGAQWPSDLDGRCTRTPIAAAYASYLP